MSLDEALSTFSEALVRGEVARAADQLDVLSDLADELRKSQRNLRDSQDDLHQSQADFRQSQDDLHQSQADFRQSQDDLHQSQDDLRQSQDDLHQSQDDFRQSQDDLRRSQDDAQAKGAEIQQLHRALESRDIIGQAKGMLMERFNIDAAGAFQMLVKLSQTSNTQLTLIAGKLVELDHPSAEPTG